MMLCSLSLRSFRRVAPKWIQGVVYGGLKESEGGRRSLAVAARLVLATDSIKVEANGRLACSPCSLVRYDSAKADGHMTIVRANKVHLAFDGPVSSIIDIANRKITRVE